MKDLIARLRDSRNQPIHSLVKDCTTAADALESQERELAAYRAFYRGVEMCFGDTWECEGCGRSEPWWTESNADYETREARTALAALDKVSHG